jgi:DNA-binding CsgD family transcriptional regulator
MAAQPPLGLRGRTEERAVLERLLANARAGQSGVLVIRGEAGVGKTALLRECIAEAPDFRVARSVGVESEMELAFAGLHPVCAPMLTGLGELPEPQANALSVAFGLSPGDPPDRFLVALAVLSLLSDVAERRPLLCVIDDAQWLDRASAQVLGFVARRLLAERVALVFAVRQPHDPPQLAGLPELTVGGLSDADARALLDTVLRGRIDERVRDRIVEETRGNPLALIELPRGLSPAELAGGFALPDAGSLLGRIEQNYLRRVRELPDDAQRLMLLAAADPLGDATLVWRAAAKLGIGAEAAEPAASEDLLEIGPRVRFRHPLVRSAVYRAAASEDRRAAHAALAASTNPELSPDRRAWHRAHAADGPDEDVAQDLLHSAESARRRGGSAAAAAFLARATTLTPDPTERSRRALSAARAKFAAGDLHTAQALLAMADAGPLDELGRAQVQRERAQIEFDRRRSSDAPALLTKAAQRLEPLDAELARGTHLLAMTAAIYAGRLATGTDVADTARAARAALLGTEPMSARELLLMGMSARLTDGYVAAAPMLRRALGARGQESGEPGWLSVAYTLAAMEMWDDAAWYELAGGQARLARAGGALSLLPYALDYLASAHLQAGELSTAAALVEEAEGLDAGTREHTLPYIRLQLAAWQGESTHATKLAEAMVTEARARGEGCAISVAEYATAILNNGLGQYEPAAEAAAAAADADDVGVSSWALYELVEALSRSGRHGAASDAIDRLTERTSVSGTAWARGTEARSRALGLNGKRAEESHLEALNWLGRCRMAMHLARARLNYGEWLRGENRRLDAREQLREAHAAFAEMGAQGFAQRARHELLATGEKVRKRRTDTRDELTPQEEHIARLARDGRTNPEIGAELFISARTVEWHLRKVFAKLGISSRRGLPDALARRDGAASSI